MPNVRERSCSDKEVQAIRFNHNEQRCLHKKINCLKQEGACSIQLINQTHKNIKVGYGSLKNKVSKIKTNLNVQEINEYRKLEDAGKIELFKSTLKPDSAARISSYAKRLNIEYEEGLKSNSSTKHSDDLVAFNPFGEEELTRKDLLLRQISELNDRFIAVGEKEKALERGIVPSYSTPDTKERKQRGGKPDGDNEVIQNEVEEISASENISNSKDHGGRKKTVPTPRPSTAFAFTSKDSVTKEIRPASSLGNCTTDIFETEYDLKKAKPLPDKNTRKKKTSKHKKQLKYTRIDISDKLEQTNAKSETTFKTVLETEIPEENSDSSEKEVDIYKNKSTKQPLISKQMGHVKRSSSVKQIRTYREPNVSLPKGEKETKSKLKRRHTEKSLRPQTAVSKSTENRLKTQKESSKLRPSTAVNTPLHSTPRNTNRALSALSAKGSEAIKNILACMNGPQKAPFDCHANAERESKEIKSDNLLEEGRTKFLSRDCIESNLGHDLHQELRKELLQEEENNAMKIEDKICGFMDKLNEKLKSEKQEGNDWTGNRHVETMDDIMKRPIDNPQVNRVNHRRQKKFFEEEQRKIEQNKYRRSSDAWKDVNKCRYLRIEESKIDLSGINTLASNQLSLMNGLKYSAYAAD